MTAPIAIIVFPITVLLVDDQPLVAETVRKMLLDQSDIAFHYCNDASKAIQMAAEVRPTVILQDLIMPDIDGLTLIKFFRASSFTKDIPLIVLSAQEEPLIKASAFRLGANDYMVKLPDRLEVIARIRYHSAAYIHLLERNQAYKKLEESQRALHGELAEAATYVKSLLPRPIDQGEIQAKWRFLPSAQLGGDALGYHWIDDNHFVFYLFDVCGHGVGAALLSISILNFLHSKILMNVSFIDPGAVLKALNNDFPMQEHNDMFFTIWYGVYNKKDRVLTYACGGHPPAILVNTDAQGIKRVKELQITAPAIGISPTVEFPSTSCVLEQKSRLYLFSDGIYELEKRNGNFLSLDEFVMNFYLPPIEGLQEIDRILHISKEIVGQEPFVDDVSILELRFS